MKMSFIKSGFIVVALICSASAFGNSKDQPPKNRVALDSARQIATNSLEGKIVREQLEREDGKWVYSFDVKSASDAKMHEVLVDAVSGKLISTTSKADHDATENEDEEAEKN